MTLQEAKSSIANVKDYGWGMGFPLPGDGNKILLIRDNGSVVARIEVDGDCYDTTDEDEMVKELQRVKL